MADDERDDERKDEGSATDKCPNCFASVGPTDRTCETCGYDLTQGVPPSGLDEETKEPVEGDDQ